MKNTGMLRLEKSLKQRIKIEAAKQNITMGELVERELEKYLNEIGQSLENKKNTLGAL